MIIVKIIVTVIALFIMMFSMVFCTDTGTTLEICGKIGLVLAVFGVFYYVLWKRELYDIVYGRSTKDVFVNVLKLVASILLSFVLLFTWFGVMGNRTEILIFNIICIVIYSGLMFLIWHKEIFTALKSDNKSHVIKQASIGIAIAFLLFILPNFCNHDRIYYEGEDWLDKEQDSIDSIKGLAIEYTLDTDGN